MAPIADLITAMDATSGGRPTTARSIRRQRAMLRQAITSGETRWGSPPPKMSRRTVFMVALLNSLVVVAVLRWAAVFFGVFQP